MAKFIKSIFTPTEKKAHYEDGAEEEKPEAPQMGSRRQLSISRSGRMRQANKKRHSLVLDVYGDNDLETVEKPKSMEYHVHTPCHSAPVVLASSPRYSSEDKRSKEYSGMNTEAAESKSLDSGRNIVVGEKSPEEEIDNAFEIIDKS